MIRPKVKYATIVLILVAAILAGAAESQAGWWRHCGNWGWGGYGWGWGGYGWGGYGCGDYWGGYGCGYYGGWSRPYASWYGGYGSLGGCRLWGHCRYYNPCWGCYDPCGYGGYAEIGYPVAAPITGGVAPSPAPVQAAPEPPAAGEPGPSQTPPPPPAPGTSTDFFPNRSTSGLLTIWVPADAQVTINGLQTKSTGSKREYVSFGLKPGFSYKYVVQAQVARDGKMLQETKEVMLTAGGQEGVAFGFNPKAAEQLAQKF